MNKAQRISDRLYRHLKSTKSPIAITHIVASAINRLNMMIHFSKTRKELMVKVNRGIRHPKGPIDVMLLKEFKRLYGSNKYRIICVMPNSVFRNGRIYIDSPIRSMEVNIAITGGAYNHSKSFSGVGSLQSALGESILNQSPPYLKELTHMVLYDRQKLQLKQSRK